MKVVCFCSQWLLQYKDSQTQNWRPFCVFSWHERQLSPQLEPPVDMRFYRIQTCCMDKGPFGRRWRGSRFRNNSILNQNHFFFGVPQRVQDCGWITAKMEGPVFPASTDPAAHQCECGESTTWNSGMLTQECKPYLIDEKPSALVPIDAYLSLPTYPYLSIPIQSYLFVSIYMDLSLHAFGNSKKMQSISALQKL